MLLEVNKNTNICLLTPIDNTAVGVYFFMAIKNLGYNNIYMIDFRKNIDWYKDFNKEVDLFILFKGYNDETSNRQLITHLKKLNKPCVLYYPDDIHNYDLCKILAKNLNYTFHFSSFNVNKLIEEENINNISVLRFGYTKEYFKPIKNNIKYDVVFIGNVYGKRKELLDKLSKNFNVYITNAVNEKVPEILSQTKLVFNHCIGKGLNMRVFETMACGCAMLINEDANIEMKEVGFTKDINYIEYNDDNIIDVVKKYLKLDTNIIAEIAYNRVKQRTYEYVINEMFDKINNEIKNNNFKQENKKNKIGFVTIWFNRGLSYVAKNILKALSDSENTETFVYAKFGIDPANKGKKIISKHKDWRLKNVTLSNECNIQQWASWNNLDVIVFLEDFYNWEIITRLKLEGRKLVLLPMCEYIDAEIIKVCESYLIDSVLCLTKLAIIIFEKNSKKINLRKLCYIPCAVENSKISNIDTLGKDKNKTYILFDLGWDYTGRKNREKVIGCLLKYKDVHKNIVIVIKTQNKDIKLQLKNEENIIFINEDISEDDKNKLYSNIDILVSPSKWEGLGLNLYEAMSYGISVVTSDMPPMNEITDIAGYFVDGKNTEKKVNCLLEFEFYEEDFYFKLDSAIKNAKSKKKEILEKNDNNYFYFKNEIKNFFNKVLDTNLLLPKIHNKTDKIRIAHFARFSPHQSGMYETAREMVEAENNYGFDAGFIDTFRFGMDGETDRNVKTISPFFANSADILMLHTQIPAPFFDSNKKMLLVLHGRPDHCFHSEISEGERTYTTILNYFKSNYFCGSLTFWERHIGFWKAITNKPVYHVPAFCDLSYFKPEGKKYIFKHPGEPNVVFGDPWRIDANPYYLFHAFILFKKYYPKAKLHLFCKKRDDDPIWKELMIQIAKCSIDIFGDIEPLISNIDEVYRSADFLVTTQVDAVRMVREPMASGCPIIAPVGNKYTKYTANFLFPEDLCDAMVGLYKNIKKDEKNIRDNCRFSAEIHFDINKSMKELDNIINKVLH